MRNTIVAFSAVLSAWIGSTSVAEEPRRVASFLSEPNPRLKRSVN